MTKIPNIGNIFMLLRLKSYASSHTPTGPQMFMQKEASSREPCGPKNRADYASYSIHLRYQYIADPREEKPWIFSCTEIHMWGQQPSGSCWLMGGETGMDWRPSAAFLSFHGKGACEGMNDLLEMEKQQAQRTLQTQARVGTEYCAVFLTFVLNRFIICCRCCYQ